MPFFLWLRTCFLPPTPCSCVFGIRGLQTPVNVNIRLHPKLSPAASLVASANESYAPHYPTLPWAPCLLWPCAGFFWLLGVFKTPGPSSFDPYFVGPPTMFLLCPFHFLKPLDVFCWPPDPIFWPLHVFFDLRTSFLIPGPLFVTPDLWLFDVWDFLPWTKSRKNESTFET